MSMVLSYPEVRYEELKFFSINCRNRACGMA